MHLNWSTKRSMALVAVRGESGTHGLTSLLWPSHVILRYRRVDLTFKLGQLYCYLQREARRQHVSMFAWKSCSVVGV